MKGFDYKTLENKILYIPKFEENSLYAKKLIKKGEFDELKTLEAKQEMFNKIWNEAMAQSVYDASPYEIREYNAGKLIKAKDEKAILLQFTYDYRNYNTSAQLIVTHPKRQVISNVIINGLNLSNSADIRLMINMLNHGLVLAAELEEEGKDKSFKDMRNKYKEGVIEFSNNLPEMTFLAPEYTKEDYKKFEKKNKKIEEAMKLWNICKHEIIPVKEIEERRANGEDNSFYWRSIPIYTSVSFIPVPMYSLNFFINCERDEIIYYFYGGRNLDVKSVEKAQIKILEKAKKYKKKLEK